MFNASHKHTVYETVKIKDKLLYQFPSGLNSTSTRYLYHGESQYREFQIFKLPQKK